MRPEPAMVILFLDAVEGYVPAGDAEPAMVILFVDAVEGYMPAGRLYASVYSIHVLKNYGPLYRSLTILLI